MKLKAVYSKKLSGQYDPRYVLVNEETGEIVDDAQGYGYKSRQNAYAAGTYKFRDKSKDSERAKKERDIQYWMDEHPEFVGCMEQYAFEIAKGSWGPDDKFDVVLVRDMLDQGGYTDLSFSAAELLKYWERGPLYSKKKKRKKKKK